MRDGLDHGWAMPMTVKDSLDCLIWCEKAQLKSGQTAVNFLVVINFNLELWIKVNLLSSKFLSSKVFHHSNRSKTRSPAPKDSFHITKHTTSKASDTQQPWGAGFRPPALLKDALFFLGSSHLAHPKEARSCKLRLSEAYRNLLEADRGPWVALWWREDWWLQLYPVIPAELPLTHGVMWTVAAGEVLTKAPFHWGFVAASKDLLGPGCPQLGPSCPQQRHLPLHEFFYFKEPANLIYWCYSPAPSIFYSNKYFSLFLYMYSVFPVTTTDPRPWKVICKPISIIGSKEPSSKASKPLMVFFILNSHFWH